MANSKSEDTKGTGRSKGASQAKAMRSLLTMITIALIIVAALPTAIIVIIGMVPTLIAFIADLTRGRYACRCVAGLNVSGVAPYIRNLWMGDNDVEAALRIIADSMAWLAFYGSAGFGWMLYLSVPGGIATIQVLNARRNVELLRETQRGLAREWDLNDLGEAAGAAAAPTGGESVEPAAAR